MRKNFVKLITFTSLVALDYSSKGFVRYIFDFCPLFVRKTSDLYYRTFFVSEKITANKLQEIKKKLKTKKKNKNTKTNNQNRKLKIAN